jgi:hypothetical protein
MNATWALNLSESAIWILNATPTERYGVTLTERSSSAASSVRVHAGDPAEFMGLLGFTSDASFSVETPFNTHRYPRLSDPFTAALNSIPAVKVITAPIVTTLGMTIDAGVGISLVISGDLEIPTVEESVIFRGKPAHNKSHFVH